MSVAFATPGLSQHEQPESHGESNNATGFHGVLQKMGSDLIFARRGSLCDLTRPISTFATSRKNQDRPRNCPTPA